MSAPAPARRRAYRWGLGAESRAAAALSLKAYRILGRRVRTGAGEIDLVAKRGRTIAIVEVKARATEAAALEAVGSRSQTRIVRAAAVWLAQNPRYGDHTIRFDIIAVMPGRWPVHVVNAFEA
ncbi:YraN family protein [Amorphus sp. 3PC139-8]|uniref:YraN family protein n=1 Tax=Amorphus sp. 3PC139-8 TaxID=2735676 RepID=UPI00345DBA36